MRKFILPLLLLVSLISSCSEEAPKPRPAAQKSDFEILREKIKTNPNDVDAL